MKRFCVRIPINIRAATAFAFTKFFKVSCQIQMNSIRPRIPRFAVTCKNQFSGKSSALNKLDAGPEKARPWPIGLLRIASIVSNACVICAASESFSSGIKFIAVIILIEIAIIVLVVMNFLCF